MNDHHSHEPPSLPQSATGGLHPELRARITSARVVLANWDRDLKNFIAGDVETLDSSGYAHRLATDLRGLLDFIERHQS